MANPTARSPIGINGSTKQLGGWEVSDATNSGPVTLADVSAATKILVVADIDSARGAALNCAFQSTRRTENALIVGAGPGEWLVLAPAGQTPTVIEALPGDGGRGDLVDVTHGGTLLRLTGNDAVAVMNRMCAINVGLDAFADGSAFRSSFARLVCDVARDDVNGVPSYLIHADRSSGQYLFDSIMAVGETFGISVTGYPVAGL